MSEHDEQAALFEWAALMSNRPGFEPLRFLFAIPNGGHRNPVTASKLKAEGVKPGVPDVCLPAPRNAPDGTIYHGLFVELKVKPNRTTPAQVDWLAYLNEAGYLAVVCYSWQEAARVITEYLDANEEAEDEAHFAADHLR